MRKLYTFIAVAALTLLGPGVAFAFNDSGVVLKVMSCTDPDQTGSRSILFQLQNSNGTQKWFYLGQETSSTSSHTGIALAALLSGKTVEVQYGNTITKCGISSVFSLENGSNRYIQIDN